MDPVFRLGAKRAIGEWEASRDEGLLEDSDGGYLEDDLCGGFLGFAAEKRSEKIDDANAVGLPGHRSVIP